MKTDDILLALDRESARQTAAVRALLIEQGRPDLAAELDRNLRDVRLGLTSARFCWHSISSAQRRVLETLEPGRWLHRVPGTNTYDARGGPDALANVCRLPTARALCAHELLEPEGGAFDPEAKFILTDRARFVLKRGRPA